jgi:hypothetical protein
MLKIIAKTMLIEEKPYLQFTLNSKTTKYREQQKKWGATESG